MKSNQIINELSNIIEGLGWLPSQTTDLIKLLQDLQILLFLILFLSLQLLHF